LGSPTLRNVRILTFLTVRIGRSLEWSYLDCYGNIHALQYVYYRDRCSSVDLVRLLILRNVRILTFLTVRVDRETDWSYLDCYGNMHALRYVYY